MSDWDLVAAFKEASAEVRTASASANRDACPPQDDNDLSPDDVAMLQDICGPEAPREFVCWILRDRAGKNLLSAAEYIAEHDLSREMEFWHRQQALEEQRRLQMLEDQKVDKKRQTERFMFEAVGGGGGDKKIVVRNEYLDKKKTKNERAGVRYLDGVPVSSKGEKYIVIKDKEEWDGGSKGKVYTKGKRGKGYV